jgi:hypothetical protein
MRILLVAALAALILGGVFLLPGCTSLGTTGIQTGQSTQAQQAQGAINEANVALVATANVIAQNVTDGTMAKPEAQAALNQVRALAKQVDDAQVLLKTGAVLDAKTRADVASRLILTLHKEVAAKARTP